MSVRVKKVGADLICDVLNHVLFEDMTTTVLLETMAGKGSEMGKTFEELPEQLLMVLN